MMGSGMNRRNTPRGQMSMGKGGPAIQMMEGAMQAMFAPPPPLEFKKGISKRKPPQVQGVAALLAANPDMFEKTPAPPKKEYETPRQRHARIAAAKRKAHDEELTKMVSKWDPKGDKRATSDAYKTLFVAKISYDTTEKKLRREFERYGPINNLRMVNDEDGKPKGYAFIEYNYEEDMLVACKQGDAHKIDGRRVLVDVERGRTVRGWKPRRFGGGLGNSREDRPKKGQEAEWRERERQKEAQREAEWKAKREKEREGERVRREKEREEREKNRPKDKDEEADGKRSDSRDRPRRRGSRDRSTDRSRYRSRDRSRDRAPRGEDRRRRSRSRERRR